MTENRWEYGDTCPVAIVTPGFVTISPGDLLWDDYGNCRPVSEVGLCGGDAELMRRVYDNFLGVAMEESRFGQDDIIDVATRGVFRFDCEPYVATLRAGERVGFYWKSNPARLENQKIGASFSDPTCIGRVAKGQKMPMERTVLVAIEGRDV